MYGLANSSNLKLGQIYEWMDSTYLMTPRDIVRFARAFKLKPKEFKYAHAMLLLGYLRDHCFGPGADLILLELLGTTDWIKTSHGYFCLPPQLSRDVQIILDMARYTEIKGVIRILAKRCRTIESQQSQEEKA